jgi:hypothetical protein
MLIGGLNRPLKLPYIKYESLKSLIVNKTITGGYNDMIQVNNADLYTVEEMAEMLFNMAFDLTEDEEIEMYVSNKSGEVCNYLVLTKKEILTHDIIILGDEICSSNLVMFSLDKIQDNYISIAGIEKVLSGYGYANEITYYSLDCYENIVG